MIDQAISKQQKDPGGAETTMLDRLTAVNLDDSPIRHLTFVADENQGRYFQSEHWSYRADYDE
jgi:hypothetical protein